MTNLCKISVDTKQSCVLVITVKPVYNGHPRDPIKPDLWAGKPLYAGSITISKEQNFKEQKKILLIFKTR